MYQKIYKPLLEKKGVVAVGRGFKVTDGKKTDEISYVCSVETKVPKYLLKNKDIIPRTINDIPTDVVETGKIRALVDPKKHHRPAPAGVSIGHVDITAGTLGCWVKRNEDTDNGWYILSNNHVLANTNQGKFGEYILQPGVYDGGVLPKDLIAELFEFIPIKLTEMPAECNVAKIIAYIANLPAKLFNKSHRIKAYSQAFEENLVDCAIAYVTNANHVMPTINEIGNHSGKIIESVLGMSVQKSGRTTGLTVGEVEQVDVTTVVDMGGGNAAIFTDQVIAGNSMSAGGDSGSLILDMSNNITGLLFAGSDEITVYNRIQNVIEALNIRFD